MLKLNKINAQIETTSTYCKVISNILTIEVGNKYLSSATTLNTIEVLTEMLSEYNAEVFIENGITHNIIRKIILKIDGNLIEIDLGLTMDLVLLKDIRPTHLKSTIINYLSVLKQVKEMIDVKLNQPQITVTTFEF